MAYYANSQKKYSQKVTLFTVKYHATEKEKAEKVKKAIQESGESANTWIKNAIHEKLERETKKEENRTD